MLHAVLPLVALAVPAGHPDPSGPGGFDQVVLPAGTRWVIHVDVEAVRRSELGSQVIAALEEGGHVEELDEVEAELGMNPLEDLRSVTVHGARGEEDAVAQIRMSAKADEVIAQLRQKTAVRTVQIGDVQVLSMGDDGDQVFASVQETGEDERLIVLAGDGERVAHTVNVLRGRAPDLEASAASTFARGPSAGAWLFAACSAPLSEITDFEPASQAAELVRGGVLELGEHEGSFFASIEVDARSTQDARRLADIVQGGLALLELALADEEVPDCARGLLEALSAEQLGEGVRLALRLSAEDLGELLQELEQEAK